MTQENKVAESKEAYKQWMNGIVEISREYDIFLAGWDAASKQVGEENRRLREASKELLHLHSCEQEGLQYGKPTFEMWFNAVNKLSEALDGDAGNKEETK